MSPDSAPTPDRANRSAPTEYEAVVGLEVHAQLLTRTKIFCGCDTGFGAPPNHHTCPVCLGMPGVLPVLNREAVEMALRMGLAVGARIPRRSVFARKNYFYPDLPKGYQISQFDLPLCEGGSIPIDGADGEREIRLTRIHLEEDAGKLIHGATDGDPGGPEAEGASLVDFNRAGVPLIEIVAEPDIRTPGEAHSYLVRLRSIVTYLGICDGNMEEGSLRCDANVSIRSHGDRQLGTRTEIKNLNSFRNVQRALEHEIARQGRLLRSNAPVTQETRLWDDAEGRTIPMRSKEEAHDYRYFPDPDLRPLEIGGAWLDRLREALQSFPAARRARFISEHGLPLDDANHLTLERDLADYFEAVATACGEPRAASNWVRGELLRLLKESRRDVTDAPISASDLGGLIRLIGDGTISGKIAKTVFEEMAGGGGSPEEIIERLGLVQITDESAIRTVVAEVMEKNPEAVAQYRGGKTAALGFFVGQVMRATSGKANPGLVNRILRGLLEAEE